LLLLCWLSRGTADADLWWHLKTGQFVLSQHRLPVPDPFAWTTYLGKPLYAGEELTRYFNLTHEWLAQVVLDLTYETGGLVALTFLRATALSLFCALAGWMVYRRTLSFYRALCAALAVGIVMHAFPEDRPQYFTYVFLALTINILDSRRRLWLLPPLFLIWANCHGGFFLGWVAVGIYCAEDLYLRLVGMGRPSEPVDASRWLWVAGLSAILASWLNPNGFHVIEVLRNYENSPLQQQIIEWYRPNPWELSPFTILLYGGFLVLLFNRRRARPADWLLLAAFGSAGLIAWRNVVFAAWVGAVLIALYLPWPSAPKRRLVLMEFGLAGLLTAATGILIAQGSVPWSRDSIRTPAASAAGFLQQHHIQGRLFNTYAEGGYLMWRLWPQLQVFADGRALNESVAQDTQRIIMGADNTGGRSFDELLNAYGADIIVMNCVEPLSGRAYLLPAALADPQQTEWKLVYHDPHELIYLKRPPPDVQPLNSLEGLVGMEEQCLAWIDEGATACTNGMVDVFTRIGDQDRVQKWAAIQANRGSAH
jgi:hypothetical protein